MAQLRYKGYWEQIAGHAVRLICSEFPGRVSGLLLLLCVGCGTPTAPEFPAPATVVDIEVECQRVAQRLRDELGDRGEVVVRSPFVLAGDVATRELIVRFEQQIEPLARAMREAYFETVPDRPITLLLCSQTTSYSDLARHLFADEPVSNWGYYKPGRHTVIVNLERGPAGIGHEMTHALMDFDFPTAPFWFREGLAALHESVFVRETEEGVCLEGLQEGRWKAMQTLLENDRLLTLRALFRGGKPRSGWAARRYAQARFFCLFLQRKQQLQTYYQRFKRAVSTDPSGTRTLLEVLGQPGLEDIDLEFRDWLETLSNKPAIRADTTSLEER
ncbi:MAG: hypothetical protein VX346_16225 [Planctomycetota bacterium]|nr:hypothetical protein [Planctomycetota bacterium]